MYIAHTRGIASPTIRRAIDPIIGHTKSDGLLERNHLAGATGDAINAILVAAGHNLRLLVAWFRTEAAKAGASLPKMQEVSRQKKVEVLLGYVRDAALFENHPGESFL